AFSIVVMSEKEPETLVAFKDGPPLVVGVGEKELFVVSDVQAALSHTNRFIYLDDREIVAIHGQQYEIYSSRGVKISKPVVEIKWSADLVEKQGFSHYMLKEIHEQPRAVSAAIEPHVDQREFRIRLSRLGFGGTPTTELEKIHQPTDFADTEKVLTQLQRVFIVACGTSYYAGLIGKYLIENLAGVPVEIDVASEFRYRNPVLPEKTLVLTISQSGETADTLAAIRMAKEKNCLTLSICNVKNSTIDREANGHLYMNSGPEIGVASTKAFTSTIALLDCLAIQMGTLRGKISSDQEAQLVKSLLAIPNQMAVVLAHDKYFAKAAKVLNQFKGFLYIGRGSSYPIALEGALKLKELAYLHAEGYAAGEMKHGPLALIDERMGIVTIAPHDHLYEKTMSNIEEAKARGGKIIAIGNQEDDKLRKMSEHYISIPATHWTVSALLSVIPVQLMAFHLANNLGYDVDQPRNLAKSVTVE
ncbi:MAG TPA: glutamine--fructose-6-phosphate transaminase (isomerizing), partial [Pseudobdellovibrionaceae bacterium]|nr:glutamine--fructose-6-phosphate transaminase (isomerizing) [Pseudobdellovibrionaceae bacterium]